MMRMQTCSLAMLASAALCLVLLQSPGAPRAEPLSLQTRPGITVVVDYREANSPIALVVLFEGGGGRIDAGHEGFASLAHDELADLGLSSALVDAPSDQRKFMGGMHPDFRQSETHVTDIDAVVATLRARSGLPVWLLGVSLGTRSAAWYATQRPGSVDGLLLLSSSTANPRAEPVQDFPLQSLTAPLLAVAHREDACRGTPPSGARKIVAAATAARPAEVKMFSGGRNAGRQPCGLRTYHTFYGIEDEVLAVIAAFIAEHNS